MLVAFAENQISVPRVPFLPRFEIDAAFHADAPLLNDRAHVVKFVLAEF